MGADSVTEVRVCAACALRLMLFTPSLTYSEQSLVQISLRRFLERTSPGE
jgi:hypothetical protein